MLSLNYLGLLILHAALNSEEWLKVLRILFSAKSRNGDDKEVPISDNRFMTKFKDKSLNELKVIIQSPQYSKEAIAAAKELLKDKI